MKTANRGSRAKLTGRAKRATPLWLSALASALLLAAPAAADSHESAPGSEEGSGDRYSRPGGYLQLGGHLAFENFSGAGSPKDSSGIDVRLGYRLLPVLAAEVQLDWVEDFDDRGAALPVVPGNVSTELLTVTANARGYLPLGRLQPFATIGMGMLRSEVKRAANDTTREAFALRFGGGVDFYLTRYLALSLDASYVVPTGSVSEFDYTSVGGALLVRF